MTTITGHGVQLRFGEGEPTRRCGDCQLCCKLLPVGALGKAAGERCRHQRHHKGCAVYRKRGFPSECGAWSCRWLVEDDTADLSRPRAGAGGWRGQPPAPSRSRANGAGRR